MNRYDKISSLIWFFFSLCIIAGASTYSIGTLSRPGSGFLPLLCGVVLGTLSIIVFIQSIQKEKKGGKKEGPPLLTQRWPKIVMTLAVLLVYGFFIERMGYLAMTFLLIIFVLKVVDPGSWRSALFEALAATVFSYLLFEVWLKVQLPKGFWVSLFS